MNVSIEIDIPLFLVIVHLQYLNSAYHQRMSCLEYWSDSRWDVIVTEKLSVLLKISTT